MNIYDILFLGLTAVVAYFLGCVSFAYVLSTVMLKRDIRKYGSGNAGTANMLRNFGWKLGLLTFLGDGLKGVASCYLGYLIAGPLGSYVAAIAVVLGHMFPMFLKFKGGKGIATSAGVVLYLAFDYGIYVFAFAILLIALTARVSVGSIAGVTLAAVFSFVFRPIDVYFQGTMVILAAICLIAHRENIVRLIKGTEPKFDLSKKPKPQRIKDKKKLGAKSFHQSKV